MKYFKTFWGKHTLSWFWSDIYWYVTAVDKKTGQRLNKHKLKAPIGSGGTQMEALADFEKLLDS